MMPEAPKVTVEMLRRQRISPKAPGDEEMKVYHWFFRHQQLTGMPDSKRKRELLFQLTQDMDREIAETARQILFESTLERSQKTHKPCGGGIAGGEKFIVNGIFYKLAVDTAIGGGKYLYGGEKPNQHLAAKSFNAERRFANQMFKAMYTMNLEGAILTPLFIQTSFAGHTLLAMPLLPLQDAKLVYGSCDGGQSVYADDEYANSVMEVLGQSLHLAQHRVANTDKALFVGGDVEIHRLPGGELIALDFARFFPPEDPRQMTHFSMQPQAVFFRLFRPEWLQKMKAQGLPRLSADALSRWGLQQSHVYNKHVAEASKQIKQVAIPAFAARLDKEFLEDQWSAERVLEPYEKINPHLKESRIQDYSWHDYKRDLAAKGRCTTILEYLGLGL